MSGSFSYLPAFAAGAIGFSLIGLASRLRRALAVFASVYVLIGCVTYLYWIYVEAAPPHGSYVPSTESISTIAWEVFVAFAAIVAWPVWPILRAIVLDM